MMKHLTRYALVLPFLLSACDAVQDLPTAPAPSLDVVAAAAEDPYPQVGLLIFDVGGGPAWRCSGTLLSPTVVLTAGHCTHGATGGRIFMETDVGAGRPGNGYPFAGGSGIEFGSIHTSPGYQPGAFYTNDLGVVVLGQPVILDSYPQPTTAGSLNSLATRRGLQATRFTVAGYGVTSIRPTFSAPLVRHWSDVQLVDMVGVFGLASGTSLMLSNAPGKGTGGGSTCFGDSGGPVLHEGVVVGVTSFAINSNCKGLNGAYRIDNETDLGFITSFLE